MLVAGYSLLVARCSDKQGEWGGLAVESEKLS